MNHARLWICSSGKSVICKPALVSVWVWGGTAEYSPVGRVFCTLGKVYPWATHMLISLPLYLVSINMTL